MNPLFFLLMGMFGAGSAAFGSRSSSAKGEGLSRERDESTTAVDTDEGDTAPQPPRGKTEPITDDVPDEAGGTDDALPWTIPETTGSDELVDEESIIEFQDGSDQPSGGEAFEDETPATDTGSSEASPLTLLTIGSIGVHSLDTSGPITLEFSEDIRWGDGNIELRMFDGVSYVTVETFSQVDLGTTSDSALRIVDNSVIIQPSVQIDILSQYALSIDPGAVESLEGTAFPGISNDETATIVSGIPVDLPSLDPNDYDNVIIGETFNSTFDVDGSYNNTLFINCTFTDIDGYGMRLGDVSNVTIYNCTFENISETAILLRSTASTDSVSIISNSFASIGGDAIHSAARHETDVDHRDLIIQDNQIQDVGLKGGSLYHGIYTQSSEAVIWGNSITGFVDSNAISIRSDGIVWDNYINVTSGREYGSGIKYYSDHETGESKTLIIANNIIEPGNLYSGIEIDMVSHAIPDDYSANDWVVNNFMIFGNSVDAANDYVIDQELDQQSWSSIEIDENQFTNFFLNASLGVLPEVQIEEIAFQPEEADEMELDLILW